MSVTGNKTTDQSGFLYYLVDWPIDTISSITGINAQTLTTWVFYAGLAALGIRIGFVIIDIDLPGIISFPLTLAIVVAIPAGIYLWRNTSVVCDTVTGTLGGIGFQGLNWLVKKLSGGSWDMNNFFCQNNSNMVDDKGCTTWVDSHGLVHKTCPPPPPSPPDPNDPKSDPNFSVVATNQCFRYFDDDPQVPDGYDRFIGVRRQSNAAGTNVIESGDPTCNTPDAPIENQSAYDAYMARINESASNSQVPAPHEDNTDSNGASYNKPITPKHHHDPAGRNPSKKKWCTDPKNRGEAAHDPDCHWYKKGTGDTQKEWNKKLNDHMDNSDKDTSVKNIPKGKRGMMK